jgi:uncharacterized protein YjbJ (UPF0337 family)
VPVTTRGEGTCSALTLPLPFCHAAQAGTIRFIAMLSARISNHREQAMNWDRVEGNWKTFKGQVQQKWGKLTNDDIDVIEGKRTELSGRLQQRYGYAKDEADKNIDTWLNTIN